VYRPLGKIMGENAQSMAEYPNIKPGEDFDGYN
jgi:hypothetical protein